MSVQGRFFFLLVVYSATFIRFHLLFSPHDTLWLHAVVWFIIDCLIPGMSLFTLFFSQLDIRWMCLVLFCLFSDCESLSRLSLMQDSILRQGEGVWRESAGTRQDKTTIGKAVRGVSASKTRA